MIMNDIWIYYFIHTISKGTWISELAIVHSLNYTYIYISYYRIAGFCHEDFNVASHRIRNNKIRYIFYLVTFYHVRFCNCLVLCLYFSISLRSKWDLFQTLKQHYLMHESIRNSVVSASGILTEVITCEDLIVAKDTIREN